MSRQLIIIAHNIRSAHNVGSLLRTAEGLGVSKLIFTGYTPYPETHPDDRLPHIAAKLDAQIHKTALDAEKLVNWEHGAAIEPFLKALRSQGFVIAGLEQTPTSIPLPDYDIPPKLALVLGSEVEGLSLELVNDMDATLEIPMFGQKESFNVVEAATMVMYYWRFSK